jgi:hypothetical protein
MLYGVRRCGLQPESGERALLQNCRWRTMQWRERERSQKRRLARVLQVRSDRILSEQGMSGMQRCWLFVCAPERNTSRCLSVLAPVLTQKSKEQFNPSRFLGYTGRHAQKRRVGESRPASPRYDKFVSLLCPTRAQRYCQSQIQVGKVRFNTQVLRAEPGAPRKRRPPRSLERIESATRAFDDGARFERHR